ncbi:Sec1-like family protein [Dictyostelium discoideum AX4]|uniref:Protein transport protein sec1 n=1 Tax=Dictyostelium discoideum TaxID=44689 RepID=SEC1_DICDI|nr:Sec1-like family protein [Dictyostelium discoideum AX4]Q54QC8.1 RecName: Full=Protein transport protein sec1 [Dictyostelium discoideum]EAL65456.1 Sec1-like family protein [Dictyostelium discoideum AX4]|eukprot:XP_638816.1 Sec1-like family protein [Dictyostelium discoideum AX4]
MATSLRELCKDRILNEMVRTITPEASNGWKALIVDQDSLRVISACCGMFDIMEEKVTVVEKIDNPRQRLPNLEAIYFLTPTAQSIDLLINDFKKKSSPHYLAIHLFLTSKLPEVEFKKLSASLAVHRIKTFKEINLEFLAIESQAFHLDQNNTLFQLFSPDSIDPTEEQAKIATRLVSLCVSLNECPIIRFSRSHPVSAMIAGFTQEKLDNVMRTVKSFKPNDDRSTLLILDRTQDPLAPLIHEFSYQAMVYDLFDIENDKFSFDTVTNAGATLKKDVLLGETDYMWSGLRHQHIADVSTNLTTRLDEFLKTNQVSQYGQHTGSLKEAGEVVRSLPQYQEMMGKYSVHINLADRASAKFPELEQLAYLEQDLATGEDANGNSPKNVTGRLSNYLSDFSAEKYNKIRLLMMYIISQDGIKEEDRRRLMEMAGISQSEQNAFTNLRYLGVTLMKGAKGKKPISPPKNRKSESGNVPYEVSRYVPVVKDIAENIINETLPSTDFPFVKEEPIARATNAPVSKVSLKGKSKQPRWADPNVQVEETKYSGSKLIIFVIGGMTFSEMRSIYELSSHYKKNIYIGSTNILLPKKYIDQLLTLKNE